MKAWLRMIAVALTVVTMGVAVRADQLATKTAPAMHAHVNFIEEP